MNVKLISITESCIDGENLTAEQLLTYIARVSNPSNQLNKKDVIYNYCPLCGKPYEQPKEANR